MGVRDPDKIWPVARVVPLVGFHIMVPTTVGTPEALLSHPASDWDATLLGLRYDLGLVPEPTAQWAAPPVNLSSADPMYARQAWWAAGVKQARRAQLPAFGTVLHWASWPVKRTARASRPWDCFFLWHVVVLHWAVCPVMGEPALGMLFFVAPDVGTLGVPAYVMQVTDLAWLRFRLLGDPARLACNFCLDLGPVHEPTVLWAATHVNLSSADPTYARQA